MKSFVRFGSLLLLSGLAAGCAHRPTAALRSAEAAQATSLRRAGSMEELQRIEAATEQFAEEAEDYRRRQFCADSARRDHWKCTDHDSDLDQIVVTGSRIKRFAVEGPAPVATIAAGDVITNNQEAQVDEGDLVKKLGDRLIVLRQGHLVVLELVEQGRPGLRLVDSVSIADDADARGTWYDEMIVAGGRIVLLGFNAQHGVAELNVVDLAPDGRLQRVARHWLPSDDYYDDTNYGARFVGGELLLTFSFELESALERWPQARRRDVPDALPYPLLAPEDVHVPLEVSEDPTLHAIMRCPIDSLDQARLSCRTTAVVGAQERQFYATPRAAYLALAENPWRSMLDPRQELYMEEFSPSDLAEIESTPYTLVYQLPLGGGPLGVARADGTLSAAQFGLHETPDGLYLATERGTRGEALLQRLTVGAFGPEPLASAELVASFPPEAEERPWRVSRFAHGALWLGVTHSDDESGFSHATLLRQPLAGGTPRRARYGHGIDQLQPFGPWMLLAGTSRARGQTLHVLDGTRVEPGASATATLPDHHVSEDRSHAFNAAPAGTGWRFGLPVTERSLVEADIWPLPPSDLAFFAMDAGGLRPLGITDMPDPVAPCEDEVCEEWYGNARLFFIGARTFALSGDWLREVAFSPAGVETVREVQLK